MSGQILVKTRVNGEYHYEPYHNSRPYKDIGISCYCSITSRACDATSCANCQHNLPIGEGGKTFAEAGIPLILDWT